MRTTVENLYKNANYTYSELISLLAFAFIIGFLFSFDNWGINGHYDRAIGIQNLVLYCIASVLVIFLFTYIQKVIGVMVGVHAAHRISWTYLLVSILLCFVSRGAVVIFIPPTLHLTSQDHLLIGRKPFALSVKNMRVFALLPIIILTLVSVFFSELLPVSAHVASVLYWMCFFVALYSMIPIEFLVNIPLVFAKEKAEVVLSEKVTHKAETKGVSLGSILAYGSIMNLLFALTFLVCSLISQITTGFWFSAIFALLVAFFSAAIFYYKTEIAE